MTPIFTLSGLLVLAAPLAACPSALQPSALQEGPPGAALQDSEQDYQLASGESCEVFAHWRSERNGDEIAAGCVGFVDAVLQDLAATAQLAAPSGEGVPESLLINLYRRPRDLLMMRKSMGLEGEGAGPFHLPGDAAVHVSVRPMQTDLAFQLIGVPGWVLRDVGEAAGLAWLDWVAPELLGSEHGWVYEGLLLAIIQRELVARHWAAEDPAQDPFLCAELAQLRASGKFAQGLVQSPLTDGAGRAARWILAGRLGQLPVGGAQALPADWPGAQLGEGQAADLLLAEMAAQAGDWIVEADSFLPYGPDAGRFIQVARGADSGRAWFAQPAGTGDYSIRGQLTAYAPATRNSKLARGSAQGNVLLGERGGDYISVTFNTFGGVTVFEYTSLTDEFRVLLRQKGGVSLSSGVPFDFRIGVHQDFGVVEIDGKAVGTFSVKDRDMSGRFGLGAQMGRGISVWSNVTFSRP